MKHIFAVRDQAALLSYQTFLERHQAELEQYLAFLREQYAVTGLPRAVVWTDAETATHLISDIPLPAYTNAYRTVFCPSLDVWKNLYLRQLQQCQSEEVRRYYEHALSENHVMQILGHEFVHHSDLFLDGFEVERDCGIWFEEGMCEYISRKYFLTDSEFDQEARTNAVLVSLLGNRYGTHSLEDFGSATYQGDYASIFFEYWRSFLAVQRVVAQFGGDIQAVFRSYHSWDQEGRPATLTQWFSECR